MNADRGWEIHPQTLYAIAKRLQNDYGNLPWFVSEMELELKMKNASKMQII